MKHQQHHPVFTYIYTSAAYVCATAASLLLETQSKALDHFLANWGQFKLTLQYQKSVETR